MTLDISHKTREYPHNMRVVTLPIVIKELRRRPVPGEYRISLRDRLRIGRSRKNGHRRPYGRHIKPVPEPVPGKVALYVFELGTGVVKIGYSKNPMRRLRDLQAGREREIHCFRLIWLGRDSAIRLEKQVHLILRDHSCRVRGECYYMEPKDAVELIELMMAKLGIDK